MLFRSGLAVLADGSFGHKDDIERPYGLLPQISKIRWNPRVAQYSCEGRTGRAFGDLERVAILYLHRQSGGGDYLGSLRASGCSGDVENPPWRVVAHPSTSDEPGVCYSLEQ